MQFKTDEELFAELCTLYRAAGGGRIYEGLLGFPRNWAIDFPGGAQAVKVRCRRGHIGIARIGGPLANLQAHGEMCGAHCPACAEVAAVARLHGEAPEKPRWAYLTYPQDAPGTFDLARALKELRACGMLVAEKKRSRRART